jgi:ankyrin repeat protein
MFWFPRTPLHAAAFSDQCESMQMLLNHGALVNHCDTTGKSPIMLAAANGHAAAVGRCIYIDITGKSPIMLAVTNGHAAAVGRCIYSVPSLYRQHLFQPILAL